AAGDQAAAGRADCVCVHGIKHSAGEDNMRRLLCAAVGLMIAAAAQALAEPVADRAVAAAKDYVKSNNLKEPKLTILLSSLFNNSFPDFAKKWEELTGVKMEIVPLGYTDIPAKI